MKKLVYSCIGSVCFLALASCESTDYDDDDEDRRVQTQTTVTEEVVRSTPYPGVIQTQTTTEQVY